tara:strand:- start:14110 stop:14304 length:195 start_codon:yes stop_codon:yes gene_type:complete
MAKPNTKFELSVNDIALIDEALALLQHHRMGAVGFETSEIEELKAKIFHQKVWYKVKVGFQGGG